MCKLQLLTLALLATAARADTVPTCIVGSVADYTALGSAGCSMGGVTFYDFDFSGGTAGVDVEPNISAGGVGLTFLNPTAPYPPFLAPLYLTFWISSPGGGVDTSDLTTSEIYNSPPSTESLEPLYTGFSTTVDGFLPNGQLNGIASDEGFEGVTDAPCYGCGLTNFPLGQPCGITGCFDSTAYVMVGMIGATAPDIYIQSLSLDGFGNTAAPPIPEPSSITLLATALLACGCRFNRKQKSAEDSNPTGTVVRL